MEYHIKMTPSHAYFPPTPPQDPNEHPVNKQKPELSIDEKVLISFFITPAVPALIFSVFSLEYIMIAAVVFVATYLVAGVHLLVLGVPAFLLGKRLNAIKWWMCILVAFLIGGLPMGIWDGWRSFLPFALFGASGGFVFWLLWKFWIHPHR